MGFFGYAIEYFCLQKLVALIENGSSWIPISL